MTDNYSGTGRQGQDTSDNYDQSTNTGLQSSNDPFITGQQGLGRGHTDTGLGQKHGGLMGQQGLSQGRQQGAQYKQGNDFDDDNLGVRGNQPGLRSGAGYDNQPGLQSGEGYDNQQSGRTFGTGAAGTAEYDDHSRHTGFGAQTQGAQTRGGQTQQTGEKGMLGKAKEALGMEKKSERTERSNDF